MCEFSLERKVFKQFRLTFELFIALQGINKCILFPSFSLSLSFCLSLYEKSEAQSQGECPDIGQ